MKKMMRYLTTLTAMALFVLPVQAAAAENQSSEICTLEPVSQEYANILPQPEVDDIDAISAYAGITINITSPCDEEWRSRYPDTWMWEANQAVEGADDYLISQFGINYLCVAQNYWTSPNGASYSALLDDAKNKLGLGAKGEIMVAFTGEKLNGVAGFALGSQPYCLIYDQGRSDNIHVTQHETGHCYGLNHCPENTACIMSKGQNYRFRNQLCSSHHSQWSANRYWHLKY